MRLGERKIHIQIETETMREASNRLLGAKTETVERAISNHKSMEESTRQVVLPLLGSLSNDWGLLPFLLPEPEIFNYRPKKAVKVKTGRK